MKKACCMLVLLLGLTLTNGLLLCDISLAAPSVKLTVNPSETTISTGSPPIALTARASGSGLKFEWKLLGPGRLDGPTSDTAIFYAPPSAVDGGAGRAIVSVRVTDKQGEDTTESVIFDIKGSASQVGKGTGQGNPDLKPAVQQVDEKGFSFALQQCKRSGSNLNCHFLITNRDQDKKLKIYRYNNMSERSRLIDEFGNEHISTFVQLGNYSTKTYSVENSLVVEVPTKSLINFENISPEVKTITLLELVGYSGNRFSVQLRNIPISR